MTLTFAVYPPQVDEYDRQHANNTESDINKTDMREALQVFASTFMGQMQSCNKKEVRDKNDRLAAAYAEF